MSYKEKPNGQKVRKRTEFQKGSRNDLYISKNFCIKWAQIWQRKSETDARVYLRGIHVIHAAVSVEWKFLHRNLPNGTILKNYGAVHIYTKNDLRRRRRE